MVSPGLTSLPQPGGHTNINLFRNPLRGVSGDKIDGKLPIHRTAVNAVLLVLPENTKNHK